MYNIAVCDDEENVCSNLEAIIFSYMEIRNRDYNVEIFHSAKDLLQIIDEGKRYDVIFLDIEMEGLDGIGFGRILRENMEDERTKIVYISWKDSYAMNLFEIRPMDFIVKPLSEEKIHKTLDTAMKLIDSENQYFEYKVKNECNRIKFSDILYFKSANRKIFIHTNNEILEFYGKLEDTMRSLDSKRFWRIHKSSIVNYMHVRSIRYADIEIDNGEILSISQKYRADIRSRQMDMRRQNVR